MLRRAIPMPVNLNDCMLLWQMGYEVHFKAGKVTEVSKRKKLLCRAAQ